MEDKIVNLLDNTVPRLVFALLSGLAYFTIIYRFIVAHTERGGGLLAFFFCPAIVCGAALIIIKLLKQAKENENKSGITMLFCIHIILILIAAIYAVSMVL